MTQAPQPPAGWYPQGDHERWWDGSAWSDHTRPLPGYLPYQPPPVKQGHTARNLLIFFAVVFLLIVGGCVAVVAVAGKKINDVVNDDTPGGPNNPLTITAGEPFEVDGFEYAAGWSIAADPLGQLAVEGLKVTNHRGKADRLNVRISLLDHDEVVASAFCTADEGFEKIPEDTTVPVDCSSSDAFPTTYDEVTIRDSI